MTKGMIFDPATSSLKFVAGSREVISNAGKMVNFLPPAEDFTTTFNVVFPDFSKDYLYTYSHVFDHGALAGQVAMDSSCGTFITVVPQEYSTTTNLDTVPTGADIFIAEIRLTRTAAPSHSWGGSSIDPLPPMGTWIPFNGSILMEAELGMVRAFSLYISGGNLVLHRQQSVSTAPGGYGSWGTTYSWLSGNDGSGGSNTHGGTAGIPVVPITVVNVPVVYYTPNIGTPNRDARTEQGGPNACSTSLSTNFSSTYQVEIRGKYGRRS